MVWKKIKNRNLIERKVKKNKEKEILCKKGIETFNYFNYHDDSSKYENRIWRPCNLGHKNL